jgi:hypothetical protein
VHLYDTAYTVHLHDTAYTVHLYDTAYTVHLHEAKLVRGNLSYKMSPSSPSAR